MARTIVTAKQLKSDLKESVAEVIFLKQDGTTRCLKCTLMKNYLPEEHIVNAPPPPKEETDLMVVWDVENNGWRSFHTSQIISCQIINW
jgi:hypothetical protein